MAEITSEITVAPGTTTPQFDLLVTSTEPIRLTRVTNDNSTNSVRVTAFGSAANDSIVVSSTADPATAFFLLGDVGDDTLTGSAVLVGGSGNDTLTGGDGGSALVGEAGNDILMGGGSTDDINGGAGNDLIFAGGGTDFIVPGAGRDVIDPGPGRDTIIFERGSTGTKRSFDVISNFARQDLIQIDLDLLPRSGLNVTGRLAASKFRSVQSIRDLDEDEASKIVYERGTGGVYYLQTNGKEVRLFRLDPELNISAKRFEILNLT